MRIKVDYLDSEIIATNDGYRRNAKSTKSADATMVGIYAGQDGTDYCYIILSDTGEIKRVAKEMIKVVESDIIDIPSDSKGNHG